MKNRVLDKLLCTCPDLKNDIDGYLTEFSDIHLHLIFGDVFNPYFLKLLEDPTNNKKQLTVIAQLIEEMSAADEYTQEVVVTTVLERLSDEACKFKEFQSFAGVNTVRLMKKMQ